MSNTVYAVARQGRAQGMTGISRFNVQDGLIRYGQFDGQVLKDGAIGVRAAANTPEIESRNGLQEADRAIEQPTTAQLTAPELQPEKADQQA